ncbi:DnaD domain protein [Streptococcus ratti]|uniref:Replication initiation and membrane attachment protein n=1 Tax=Streptococcus ratti FA-1 = DSM 20564 TaxID=699248 RepID=A0ABP2R3I2_STRRT|nr:DnaD domain protein [Streptococcus ratti]EJN94961.1 replication initiation and membrane attachment protein [Streptococcus ratti FA-1 = DSM 20564]EMP71593.1 replication initiation and membrane attachment protein [Streptococcus ratti FA-1 = DSM 20564]QEY06950.1 helicase loader [Streptococcus ratti]VEI59373.1 putative chromosome replication protein [Streptococcus mutans]
MKPIDEFLYVRQNYLLSDTVSLMRFYLPIIGSDAAALYQYFISFFDNGEKRHKFSEVLNHTQFGMARFEESLYILTAMDLLVFYKKDGLYYIKLLAPLTAEAFCKNAVYRNLLEQKIGQVALEYLKLDVPKDARDLSKKFSDVFGHTEQPQPKETVKSKTDFDLDSFKHLMARDGLQFADEQTDAVALYVISEKYKLTWYETYLLAKETASQHKISTKRMQLKKEQAKRDDTVSQFSKEEQIIIHEAKSDRPEIFLAKIKKTRHAAITADERKLLADLAEMSFLDEVINVMVLYTVSKTNSANLNKRYLMKIANDFAYQKVASAEQAVEKMRAFSERKTSQNQGKTKAKSNVPEWSNQDYKNETTADEQARLDEIKRQTLARLRKDGE